jgi:hypothetical protein
MKQQAAALAQAATVIFAPTPGDGTSLKARVRVVLDTEPSLASRHFAMQIMGGPVVVEAVQIPTDYATSHGRTSPEFWERDLLAFIEYGRLAGTPLLPGPDDILIQTLEHKFGEGFHASPGDWLIRGVKGEVYACKPDIFAATYEPVGAEREARSRELLVKARDALVGALYWLNLGEEAAHAMSPTVRDVVRQINAHLGVPT